MADLSELRVECPHAAACGGCPLLALPYAAQLEHKARRLRDALARFPLLRDLRPAPVAPADPVTEYRARAKLVAGAEGVGLYGAGTHALVDLPGCRVITAPMAAVLERVRERIRAGAVDVHEPPREGLRAIDLRGSALEPRVLVTLVTDPAPAARASVRALATWLLEKEPAVAGVALSVHAHGQPRLLGAPAVFVGGARHLDDRVGPTRYVASSGSFVQAHRVQAARMHALVAAEVQLPGARVLDLFGGGGGIGVALARAGARVTLVESYGPAVEDALASAARNGVHIDALVADVEDALGELVQRGERFDLAVLNPPRRGCTPGTRLAVAALAPARVAYVSCEPDSLARDLDHLRRLGYAPRALCPLDMIPLTDEVETVALLERAPPPPVHVLHDDHSLLVLEKWPHEAAEPRPGRRGSLRDRVRALPGWERAVVALAPDEGASGIAVCLRGPGVEAPWTVEGPRVEYLVLARGITSERGVVRRALPGAPGAATRYRRLEVVGGHALLRAEPKGGSAAHLRRHLAAIGHPVAGDGRYGHEPTNRHLLERFTLTRPFAHLASMAFRDRRSGAERCFESALSPDLALVLDRLRARPTSAREA